MDKYREDKLDHLFRDKLQDHEVSPGEDYWPFLEKSLNKISFFRFGWKHINIYNVSLGVLMIAAPILYALFQSDEKNNAPANPLQEKTETITAPTSHTETNKQSVKEILKITKKSDSKSGEKTSEKKVIPSDLQKADSLPLNTPAEEIIPITPEPAKIVEEKPKPKPKKIIYVVEQDTIVQKDTVKVRRKRKN